MTAVPIGLGLAAALVLLSTPYSRDGTPAGTDAGAEAGLPDNSASPNDDFFAAPDDAVPTETPSPTTSEHGATARGDDQVEMPASPDGSEDTDGDSDGSEGSGGGTQVDAVVDLVNEERADAGCDPVSTNGALTRAAEKHSKDMAARDYMAHESPDGTTPAERAQSEGYDAWSGENVAAGYDSPEAVMEGWMNSPGHRRNILNCDNTAIGVGEHQNRWTQMFGSQ
ncbi:uncharacterized protein YkwD [Lipingzhangella halophila]|uniref:Uncharacterized protein YkwD n=1 Tax=Lipingzhangella halophila TaxID=1783352 RepID=A0A7W7REG0_9ACTN|nr:CAP domain-containing protein [Lipingzhangella halophila]MBB4930335.1 uncharacterized protein YkwD [Lipingzhangella halophila]